MHWDKELVDRIRNILELKSIEYIDKRMFGGTCFMVDEKMCLGTFKGGVMARVGPDSVNEYLEIEGVEQMTNAGRTMKGYLNLLPEICDSDEQLEFWISKCLDFNPNAKSSKKKKKKA